MLLDRLACGLFQECKERGAQGAVRAVKRMWLIKLSFAFQSARGLSFEVVEKSADGGDYVL